MFKNGEIVWCRPQLIDEPICAKYVRKINEAERKEGYRAGHIIEINGIEHWIRLDLCAVNKESIIDISC